MDEVGPKIYRFGPFEIDLEQRLLIRAGDLISLTPKAFDTLAVLVARPGHVFDKAELLSLVWPDTFVEENNLNQNVSALRKILGEGYIETIPRRGYRFVMPVEDPPPISSPPSAPPLIQSPSIPRIPLWIWGVASIVAIALLAYFTSMPFGSRRRVGHPVNSLVVLPFMNLSDKPDSEYFSDGLTEEITNVLSHIDGLRVVARTSAFQFKGKGQDVREIARQLHVDAVLEGSVRREQNRLRVTAQLNDALGGYHIWSRTYDRDDGAVFEIQDDISRQIARSVRPNGGTLAAHSGARNLEAYNLYLKGLYFWNKRGGQNLKTAIGYFQNSIAIDSGYALAWSGLADSYATFSESAPATPKDWYPRARAAAQRALALDPTLAEAQTTLAYVKFEYDWDWAGAERDFRKALDLNLGYPTAHQWYGQYLAAMGRFDEAVGELKRAQELDPVSLAIQINVGRVYRYARRYDQAIDQLRAALAMDSNSAPAHFFIGLSYMFQSRCSEAIGEYKEALQLRGGHYPSATAYLGYTYARCGERGRAQEMLQTLLELSKHEYVPAGSLVTLYGGLGDKDRAFHSLEKAVEERDFDVVWLKIDPLFDSIRSDPRLAGLLRRLNLGP